jgi:hypothetical protein
MERVKFAILTSALLTTGFLSTNLVFLSRFPGIVVPLNRA